ncbi:MAG: Nif3-like dinuclear metal center hexameric protein [Chlorobi bacterium]|nr:Nif3-like dinuclear metal center hexameric protein [Chlorobiota bacterium]
MKVKDVVAEIERFAPPGLKADYDNVGLLVGSADDEVTGVLISLDVTEEVVDEAIREKCSLIVAHHPLIFSGLKNVTDKTEAGRVIIKLLRNGISVFAGHTNVDSVFEGVSGKMADKLGLVNRTVLSPVKGRLIKLVVFVPAKHAGSVREAMFSAGAGVIGNYDSCSYNVEGEGTFRAGENTNPFVGEKGKLHVEKEVRIELVMPDYFKNAVIEAMLNAHPYEEVAYDIYRLENEWPVSGYGMIGDLENPMNEVDFLSFVKQTFNAGCIRHTAFLNKQISKVALCGGSGSDLLENALSKGADVFITADFKYHQFFDAGNNILIADIGHFESEQFTKELFFEILTKKFSNFAVRLSKVNTNPIKYF